MWKERPTEASTALRLLARKRCYKLTSKQHCHWSRDHFEYLKNVYHQPDKYRKMIIGSVTTLRVFKNLHHQNSYINHGIQISFHHYIYDFSSCKALKAFLNGIFGYMHCVPHASSNKIQNWDICFWTLTTVSLDNMSFYEVIMWNPSI